MSKYNPEFERSDVEFWEQFEDDPHPDLDNFSATMPELHRLVWLDDLFRPPIKDD